MDPCMYECWEVYMYISRNVCMFIHVCMYVLCYVIYLLVVVFFVGFLCGFFCTGIFVCLFYWFREVWFCDE